MRSGVIVGYPVWVRLVTRSTLSTGLGPRSPMVVVEAGAASTLWCLVCVASVGYLWCACRRGCVDGGGLSACLPVESVPALCSCLCVWQGCGGWCAGRSGRLWAAGVLLPCVWRFVLSGGGWLVCALRGSCGAWSAWVVSVWVFGVRC